MNAIQRHTMNRLVDIECDRFPGLDFQEGTAAFGTILSAIGDPYRRMRYWEFRRILDDLFVPLVVDEYEAIRSSVKERMEP